MKYIVLGAGGIGSIIAEDLSSIEETTQVCIGDINLDSAQRLAQEIGTKVTPCPIDIYDTESLAQTIKDYDVVVNTVGPFYKTGETVLKVCIAKGINYVDIADDSAAAKTLLKYEKECEKAGITAIISHGASPGITNMLGLLGASKMEVVDEIHTSWVESTVGSEIGPANIWHALEMCSGMIPQFLKGELVDVPALSGTESMRFREKLGRWPVHYVGHSEPVTIPKYIKGLKTVTNRGNAWPETFDFKDVFGAYNDLGLSSTDILKVGNLKLCKRDIAAYSMIEMVERAGESMVGSELEDVGFQIRVDVKGKAEGRDVHYVYTCATDMNDATGLSASYGAQCLARGKINAKGLFAPEGCQDPDAFFKHLTEKGFRFYEMKTVEKQL